MASLYILTKVYKALPPNTFVPAIVSSDIVLSSICKVTAEHMLLKLEMSVYNCICLLPILTIKGTNSGGTYYVAASYTEIGILCFPFVISSLITFPVIYGVPCYRTYKSIVNNKLEIIKILQY
jgi:hypothetical protein